MKKIILTFIAMLLAGVNTALAQGDVARNEQTGTSYSDLQLAINEASAGQTITVLNDVTLANTLNVNKGIIIEGGHHTITAANFKPALKVTGSGDVTINKTNIDTYYEAVDVNGYTDGGIAILAGDGYSGKLTVDYCHLVTSNRGIDIQKVGAGFSLDVKNDTITGKRTDVTEPKEQYINTFDTDPYQTARGINFSNGSVALNAKVENTLIEGLAYALNISNTGSHVELDVLDCTFYGRGGVNVHGSSNTVNLDNVTVNGLNNQTVGWTERFACIVEDKDAQYNDYNLKDVRAKATVQAGPNPAPDQGTNATEMFIDLRGSDATVKIKGNSGYDIDAQDRDRVGFMNYDEMQRLLDPSANNRIFFDDQAKEYFTYWFEKITPWQNTFDGNKKVRLDIKDELDATIGLHQVVPIYPVVQVSVQSEDDPTVFEDFYYDSLAKAINGEFFKSGVNVQLLASVTLSEDITPNLQRGEDFWLTKNNFSINTGTDEHHILLNPLVTVYYDGDNEVDKLFAPSDTVKTIILGEAANYYTAGNVFWASSVHDIACQQTETIVDEDTGATDEFPVNTYQYYLFDELFTNDQSAMIAIWPETYTRLEMNLKLERDLKFPDAIADDSNTSGPSRKMADENNGNRYWIDFSTFKIDKGDYSIALEVGDTVYTTVTTDIFSSANPAYYVTYDAVDSTKVNEKGANVSFKYRYYLQKDGLAVTVDPATFCGDRLTPTFQVKKKDPATDTWKVANGIAKDEFEAHPDTTGVDFYWYLVPPVSADDDSTYVSAKTYHGALVIEGITFQGTRKADFTILPRDIKDVVVKDSTNILNWREQGYTPAQIADTLLLVYNCLTHNSDTLLTKYNATTKKGDYLISVADGPEAGGKYLEVDTYSQVITVTAVEGGNYTGTLKLDFTILQDGLIDISKCMVVSDATYTSDTLPPLKRRLKVILKDPATGTETVVDSAAYTLEVHGAPESYINAQTYSNAITIKGRSTYIPSDGSSTTPVKGYYGSLDADYVIKQRDLADSLNVITDNDNQGKVILEAYAGADKPATSPATIYLKWNDNKELVPVINGPVTDPVTNNINLILTAQKDTINGNSAQVVYPLRDIDYNYTIEPAPMIDQGWYKVIFTGRGNFRGMREVKVMVLKDINSPSVASVVPMQIIPNNIELKPSQLKDVVLRDSDQTLVLGTHYSLTVIGQDKTEYTEGNPIITDSIYKVVFKGLEPYYFEADTVDFLTLYEFYSYDTNNNLGAYYNNLPNGYEPADTAMSIRVLPGGVPSAGDILECLVGDYAKSGKPAIPDSLLTFTIHSSVNIKIDMGSATSGIYRYSLRVAGIDDNSFITCDTLHWIDATAIKGYVPTTLSRSEVGPFNGYPVQSLVYLDGSNVTGTNYVYEVSPGTFQCEELKIYDDVQGDQQLFNEGGGPKWDFRNIYDFTADKVTNTRYFYAGQHYTTCLPYRMVMPDDMKVYTLDAVSSKIFGFKELSLDSLKQFMPYLLIPSKAGNKLNNPGTTTVYKTPTTDEGKLNPVVTPSPEISSTPNATMYGSNIYMDKNTTAPLVEGMYIMQSQNTWLQIPADMEYNEACVLPMRAYICVPAASPSREIMYSKFIDAVEDLKVDVADDWSNAEVYDLQGRKVDTTKSTMRKGVYIVNGEKRIRK